MHCSAVPASGSAGPTPSERRLVVDVEAHRVHVGDDEVPLTGKEFGVLTVLVAHRDKVVSRAQLMAEVWSEGWYGSTKTLDVTIGRLRQKLGEVACVERVVTVRGLPPRATLLVRGANRRIAASSRS